jgi:hypothetical protein
MADTPDERTSDDRPRPTPRPRPGGAAARPTPRPRVAGSRRERDEVASAPARPAGQQSTARPATRGARAESGRTATMPAQRVSPGTAAAARAPRPASSRVLLLVLALLCVAALAVGGFLLKQRLNPDYVDASIFSSARSGVQALYAYDYKDSAGSVQRKLDVLTGDLRDQYKKDLGQGGIIDTYKQVSATTSYQVLDVGLQQVNDAQDTATVVVFGEYVVKSVNTGEQAAPQGSECTVTPDGAQSCTQTVRVRITKVNGDWKISELTLLTTS